MEEDKTSTLSNQESRVLEDQDYWKNAELLNGRLAMIGLFAAVHNYAIFGWIIPGFA